MARQKFSYLLGRNGLEKSGIGCAFGTCSFLSCLISTSSSIFTKKSSKSQILHLDPQQWGRDKWFVYLLLPLLLQLQLLKEDVSLRNLRGSRSRCMAFFRNSSMASEDN